MSKLLARALFVLLPVILLGGSVFLFLLCGAQVDFAAFVGGMVGLTVVDLGLSATATRPERGEE